MDTFRRHLAGSKMPKEGSKMPKETFFHGDLPLESGLAARARCLGFLARVADGARGALAEAMRLKPEVNSLAQFHAQMPWNTDPRYMRLAEPTLYAGLRRAGFPDE